jgi:hypothetical protein
MMATLNERIAEILRKRPGLTAIDILTALNDTTVTLSIVNAVLNHGEYLQFHKFDEMTPSWSISDEPKVDLLVYIHIYIVGIGWFKIWGGSEEHQIEAFFNDFNTYAKARTIQLKGSERGLQKMTRVADRMGLTCANTVVV